MKRRVMGLVLACALASLFANTAAIAACGAGDPPTPASAVGVAVIAGNTAIIAFGGESDDCWSTDGVGHSHEWHAEGTADSVSVTATSVTISHSGIPGGGSVTFNREPITGAVLGSVTGVPGVNALGAGWVNITGAAAGVVSFAGV